MKQLVNDLLLPVRPALENFSRHYALQFAASISYRTFFSAIPLLAFLVTILGLVLQDASIQASFINGVLEELPFDEETRSDLEQTIRDLAAPRTAAGFVSLLLLMWSASGMIGGIRASLNAAWEATDRRSLLRGKALDVLFVWATGLLVLVAIGMVVAVRVLTHQTDVVSGTLLTGVAWFVGAVVPFLLLGAACLLVYRYVPSKRPAWLDVVPGAIIAVIAIEGVWIGYAIFAVTFTDADAVYGALGVIFGLLLFVYVSAIAFIFGAEYSAKWAPVRLHRAERAVAGHARQVVGSDGQTARREPQPATPEDE